jgi:hypothetical protein
MINGSRHPDQRMLPQDPQQALLQWALLLALLQLEEDFDAAEFAIIKPYIELSAATCAFRLRENRVLIWFVQQL